MEKKDKEKRIASLRESIALIESRMILSKGNKASLESDKKVIARFKEEIKRLKVK